MNQLLFDRSTGSLGPKAFARIQTSHLIHAVQPAPGLRFNGGEKEVLQVDEQGNPLPLPAGETKIWAHQSGANALALDINSRLSVPQPSAAYELPLMI